MLVCTVYLFEIATRTMHSGNKLDLSMYINYVITSYTIYCFFVRRDFSALNRQMSSEMSATKFMLRSYVIWRMPFVEQEKQSFL
jgi:hypothetical protein